MNFGWGKEVHGDVDTAVGLMHRTASGPSGSGRTSGYEMSSTSESEPGHRV